MAQLDFLSSVHKSTKRDYRQRVLEHDKAECAEIAGRFDRDYWDGERHVGYGGYRYDGRWRPVAETIARHYDLKPGAKILDIGCGKGFLLYEFTQVVPGAQVTGIDISTYAIDNAKEEVRPFLQFGSASQLPFADHSFDLVISLNVFHNLFLYDLWKALTEMERVGKDAKYLVVETYRNEREKVNLLYWQLTCRAFHTPAEWTWLFEKTGYTGDHGYIMFE
jgi:protein-L-isoaspartate(D-aspartate) O-methyltransferase